ncbi:MAG: hypothetical protein ABL958_20245 [Bdellovibrionia bacterium]
MERLLFEVFEEKLLSLDAESTPTVDDFAADVVSAYLDHLIMIGHFVPGNGRADVERELYEDVLTMTRKKTYGYFNLREYVRAKLGRV